MAKSGNNHKGGAPTFVERIGVAQLVRACLANIWEISDPERKIIEALAKIAMDESEPTNNRLAAIKLLAAYLWGNPKTMIEADFGKSAPTIIFKQANE